MQNLRLEPYVYNVRFCRQVLGRPLLMLETMALHVSKPCVHRPLFNTMSSYTWVFSRTVPKGFSATGNQKTVSPSTCSVRLDYLTMLLCLFCSGRMCLFIFRCIQCLHGPFEDMGDHLTQGLRCSTMQVASSHVVWLAYVSISSSFGPELKCEKF